jgi:hypothetical protein
MAVTNQELFNIFLENPNMSDSQIVSLMETRGISPEQVSATFNIPVGEIAARVADVIPPNQAVLLGDTYVQAVNTVTGSGQDQQVGGLENVITYKATDNKVGGNVNYYSPTGEYEQTTKQKEVAGSFLGGLAEAFNDPVVQAAFLGLGGGGALGNALGLTGSTAQAVGTGLFRGGAAAAGGASLEDALKTGLLSGGLVYGGNALNNYLTTGSAADVGITERQFAIQDARQLADQGLTSTQIRDTLSAGGYNDAIIDRALTAITTTPVAISTPVTDGITITGQAPTSLNNVINTISGAAPTVTVTAPKQIDQATLNAVTSQLNTNLTNPSTTPTVQVTGDRPATTQEIINAITATIPTITPTQAATVAEQVITSGRPVSVPDVIAAITTSIPIVTTPTTIPTTTITATKPVTTPETINTIASTLTPTAVTTTTTPTTTTTETDPLKVIQLALAAAGLLGAGSVLSNTPTPTGFDIVPIPESFVNPPATKVAPFTPLTPIDFGNRNLLMGTQWEKFLDPNYGQVPEPIQYSQPSSLSYNDLMGILGSKQGMPAKSSLSINDIISGIQNQYGQAPSSTMG